jgi:hypothetical protein
MDLSGGKMKKLVILLIQMLFKFLSDETAFGTILNQVSGRLVTPELANAILDLVAMLMTSNLDGEKKREMVKESILKIQGPVGESARNLANWVLDVIIQQAFLALAAQTNKPKEKQY